MGRFGIIICLLFFCHYIFSGSYAILVERNSLPPLTKIFVLECFGSPEVLWNVNPRVVFTGQVLGLVCKNLSFNASLGFHLPKKMGKVFFLWFLGWVGCLKKTHVGIEKREGGGVCLVGDTIWFVGSYSQRYKVNTALSPIVWERERVCILAYTPV